MIYFEYVQFEFVNAMANY